MIRDAHGVPDAETAVRVMTLDAATSLRHDDVTGSIGVGGAGQTSSPARTPSSENSMVRPRSMLIQSRASR